MTIEKAHQVLEKAGFDAVARDCLERRKQLFDIALFVEKQGFGWLDKETINKDAKENRLMKFVISINKTGVMFSEQAHQILKNAGLDSELRKCLVKNNQLIELATICERNKGFGLDKETLNKLAKENRLNEDGIAIEKAHQVLREVSIDVLSRDCLAKRGQLIDIANFVKRYGGFDGLDEETLNKLVTEDCLMSTVIALEKYRGFCLNLRDLDKVTMNKLAKRRANYFLANKQLDKKTVNIRLAGKNKSIINKTRKALRVECENLIGDLYVMYLSELRRSRRTVSLRKDKRYARRSRQLNKDAKLLLKGRYIELILNHCHYLLTSDQLCSMCEKFQITPKDIEKLCEKLIIYRQEQNGTFLYAESENKFEQNWDSQIEYFNDLFNRSGFTKTNRLISSLIENALLEKGWMLDKIYVSILISKVLQIPVNIHENITEKKTKG